MTASRRNKMRVQSGVGLLEVMIVLALGVVILLGVTEIANNNSYTRYELERSARQIENATYALRTLETDLRSAGFWGEAGEQPAGANLPPVCPGLGADLDTATDELTEALGYPVQGEDELGSICVNRKAGSGFLAIRRASSCQIGTAGCDAAGTNFHLQVNACFVPDNDAAPLPGTITIDTDLDALTATQRDCTTQAPEYRLLSRVYFINSDDQLVRAELVGSGTLDYVETPLIEGIEMMRFEYGLDTDGDGQVDSQTNAPSGTQWADVAMVKVSLVVRNLQPSAGFTDDKDYTIAGAAYDVPADFINHRREVYSRTVSLRNVAGRREQQ